MFLTLMCVYLPIQLSYPIQKCSHIRMLCLITMYHVDGDNDDPVYSNQLFFYLKTCLAKYIMIQ